MELPMEGTVAPLDPGALHDQDPHPPDASPLRGRESHRRRGRRVSRCTRFLRRLDVCWTILFFLFLVCVGAITTSVSQSLISHSLLASWHALHGTRVESITRRLSIGLDRVHDIATATVSLHLQRATSFEDESTVKVLCSTLDNYDKQTRLRALMVTSRELTEGAGCMHGLVSIGTKRTLTAYMSRKHIVNGSYLVNTSSYAFARPLQMVSPWTADRQNLSVTIPAAYDDDPLFPTAEAYYRGEVNHTDLSLRWTYRSTMPHLILYSLPAGFLMRGMPRKQNLHPTDFVQVRLDGSLLLTNYDYLRAPDFSVAAFMNFSLSHADPIVLSNNWGQASASNTTLYSTSADPNVTYLHCSNISNPLMRAALKHVHLPRLRERGYKHTTTTFTHHGAKALVTAYAFHAQQGLAVPLVFVSAQASITGPYLRIMYICNGVTAIVIVAFTAFFWWFIHRHISQPLEDMTRHLHDSVKPGARSLLRRKERSGVRLSEVEELLQVYNATMAQLREIDTYIPEALRERIRNGAGLDDLLGAGSSLAAASQPPSHAAPRATCLAPQHVTVVYIRVRPPSSDRGTRGGGDARLDDPLIEIVATEEAAAAVAPRRGQRLAAVVESAAQASCLVNTGPFPSRAALAAFATAVHELSYAHHGVVHRLTPDSCTLHFAKAVRTHQARHPETATPTAATAAPPGSPGTATAPLLQRRRHSVDRLIAWDAHEAVAFALALQQWLDRYAAGTTTTGAAAARMPDVRVVVDSGVFVCGQHCADGGEATLAVALGRDVMREVGHVPQRIGVRVALTEEAAERVRGERVGTRTAGVRQLPVEALRMGRVGLDADVVILYEALPDVAAGGRAAWLRYSGHVFDAFALMLHSDYAGAHRALSQIAAIADLEPGLMPRSLRREAAPSDVTGGAVSTQAERLLRECERRIAAHVTAPFYRERRVPLGIDAVLRGGASAAAAAAAAAPPPRSRSANATAAVQSDGGVGGARGGVRAPVPMPLTKSKERHVVVVRVDGQAVRHVIADPPRWVKDNYGMYWYLPAAHGPLRDADYYTTCLTGLGSAGLLSTVTAFLLRDVPPLVAKAIAAAPAGPMCDALRSAVPVCEPSAAVCAQVQRLFHDHRQLRHPNLLLPVAYTYALEGGVAMIGEYCPGGSLREVVARYHRIDPLTAIRFGLCVLAGLSHLHSRGVVHGALSVDAVMVGADGVCRLTGFFADHARASAILVLRRTCYVSPAMAAGAPPTPACDMFCYGLLALEVVARQPPWVWAAAATEAEGETDSSSSSQPHTAEALAALMAEGGEAFSAAVVAGRVVPNAALLDTAAVADHYGELARRAIRDCLAYDAALRPTAAEAWEVCRTLLAQRGLRVADD